MAYLTNESKDNEHGVHIDLNLIHDIIPQDGGGAEPLGQRAEQSEFRFIKEMVGLESREMLGAEETLRDEKVHDYIRR
jgi:hypothetical protein